jgi:MFS family permease
LKLNIVPPRTGFLWVKQGIRTFTRKPMALTGLFFMFMAAMSVATVVPVLGSFIALMLLPAATLGLMAATRESDQGNFPMPSILLSAFRAGKQRLHAMLLLGVLYALGFLLVMGASALADGGQFASLYLVGGKISPEMLEQSSVQWAVWIALALYMPLSILFWHAPGLVHWHGVSPIKSLFFSAIACFKNMGAFTVFGLAWTGVFIVMGILLTILATVLGSPAVLLVGWFPAAMLLLAMFFCSIYFSFRDCFIDDTVVMSPHPAT